MENSMNKTLTIKPSTGFKKKAMVTAIASAMLGMSGIAFAQQDDNVEEVLVTGIKGSLQRAMDIKRDGQGVVDAISAEDIGKFPDTNLAESLQRISGVSISRANNEGSEITVRGFGPDFNLVTLNGRQMPTNGNNRSFDFSDLAAESVSGVEVFKTFSATKASGGIGSLVNIKTARPLDNPGLKVSVGAKAVMDTTNVVGDDVSPEVSGIFSNTFADDTFGVLISGSYQERDSREVKADIASWRNNLNGIPSSAVIEDNRSDPEGNVFYPRNFGYGIDDISRERTNGQLVLQYAPTDTLKATLDYTYVKVDYAALNTGVGIWYSDTGAAMLSGVIDKNGTFVKVTEAGEDYASNIRSNTSETENKSLGFNIEWQASDNLSLSLDVHDSEGLNQGVGRGNDAFLILGAKQIQSKTYDATSGSDIPNMDIVFDPNGVGVVNGLPTAASYDSLFGQAGTDINKSDVTQVQFAGKFDTNADSGITSIDFGLAQTEIKNRWRSFNTGQIAAGWYGGNQDLFPSEIFTEEKLTGLMPSFSGGGSSIPVYHTWDFDKGVAIAEAEWAVPGGSTRPWGFGKDGAVMRPNLAGSPVSDHTVTEETTSAYVQFNNKGDLAGMPLSISTGLRYESTDIEANSFQKDPTELVWVIPTEWSRNLATDSRITSVDGSYDVWLPSLDVALEVTDDVVSRLSFSQSISRPTLGSMIGTVSVTDRPKPGARTGTEGNPDLLPFTANNFDLSTEWYYAEGSYLSAGLFVKQVDNFIVNQIFTRTVVNLRDPMAGPRADAARAQLEAANIAVTDTNLYNQMNTNAGTTSQPIVQNNNDPLAEFKISKPVNLEQAELYGIELAAQHMFGESGFGVMANATLVDGDLEVDNSSTDFQFVLPGLSDSANLVAFYDKNGLQARVAYNWRDTFLNGVGENNAPYYTEAYGQIDLTLSYDLPFVEGMTVFIEGINVTDESQRVYSRYKNQFKSASQYGARYNLGVRYTF
jgi:TonB-dependent receptor